MAQRKKDKIRDNILKKSLTLFRNKGYNETSIKDIAQACDISVGNIYKYYKSIEIQPGDTLWDIAESTMTSEYDSVQEYVQVLKEMNNLDSDDIQAGQYLMIAYNDTEFLP